MNIENLYTPKTISKQFTHELLILQGGKEGESRKKTFERVKRRHPFAKSPDAFALGCHFRKPAGESVSGRGFKKQHVASSVGGNLRTARTPGRQGCRPFLPAHV
jgi:hypothetical protein